MTEAPDLSLLKPRVRTLALELLKRCEAAGVPVSIVCAHRSPEEQDALYARGRTAPGVIVTHARGGDSFHNYGVAFDVRLALSERVSHDEYRRLYAKAGAVGQALGLEWGGAWKNFFDPPHFQYTAGHTVDDFKNGRVSDAVFAEPR